MAKRKKFYITTAIDYPSGKPHLGHCYEKVCSDVLARWFRMSIGKENVFFMTGVDEHGLKIQRKAEEMGVTPQQYVDTMVSHFYKLCESYSISYDKFIRTTDKDHIDYCQKVLKEVYKNGDIYKDVYEGLYCVDCETYYTESELVDGKCPSHLRQCEHMKEESYFFRMGKYQKKVEAYLGKGYVLPKDRKSILMGRIKEGVKDLCISRSSFSWGIPLPFDKSQYAYVWFDALLNYASGVGKPSLYKKFWPADLHVIGHDILWHHSVIWLSMLMSAKMELPKNVFVHGFINAEGGVKMSKSLGNVIDPVDILGQYPADSVRYFLIREIPFGNDGAFSVTALMNRHNNELANDLGNLLQRTAVMIKKYFDGKVPEKTKDELSKRLNFKKIGGHMEKYEIHNGLADIWKFVNECNKYVNDNKPWELVKSNPERLKVVMYNLAESLRMIGILIKPFMPTTADKVAKQLGIADFEKMDFSDLGFGGLKQNRLPEPEILFTKIEEESKEAPKMAKKEEKKPAEVKDVKVLPACPACDKVPFDEFKRLKIMVGKVAKIEKHPNAEKLYVMLVNFGNVLEERQIVAGIAKHYTMEQMLGKEIVVVTNLQPAVIRGVESNGMLLAAVDEKDNVKLVVPDGKMVPGAKIQ